MEDYEYLWLLAGGDPAIEVANAADPLVGQIVQSRTLYSLVPTDLAAARAAIAQALGGPTASKAVAPASVLPGEDLTYTLTYSHSGTDTTLVVTDTVPDFTQVVTANGPGNIQINGQAVTWTTPVAAGETLTLTIQATAGLSTGIAVNTAVFSSTEVLTREVTVLAYEGQVLLPFVAKNVP